MTRSGFTHVIDISLGIDMAYFAELASTSSVSRPMPGSELADQFKQYTIEQQLLNPPWLAWRGIASASEHAGFAEHMRYVTEGGVIERPQTSLARATLIGAARAIYLLSPDEAGERAIRAAKLANAEAEDARRMIHNFGSQLDPDDFIGDLEKHSRELAAAAAEILIAAGQSARSKINETGLIKSAVLEMPDTPPDCIERVLTLWNRASGIAHARSWTWSLRGGEVPQRDFVGTWLIPVAMLCRAWQLWNLRRGRPFFPQQAPRLWTPNRLRWGNPSSPSLMKKVMSRKNSLAIVSSEFVRRLRTYVFN